MPRMGRLHIPGGCYHVIGRGLERRYIFEGDVDKLDFLRRLGEYLPRTEVQCLAWAIMSNHYHFLLRVGSHPLSKLMAPLLGGYASYYNRRYNRAGYVFQNRFKSILCDEDNHLLELIRYIHLNPMRAGMIDSLTELDSYAWTGHAGMLGIGTQPWHAVNEALVHFGDREARARIRYREFIREGIESGKTKNLSGGGLIRSYDGWETLSRVRSEHERCLGDERILGNSEFVVSVLAHDELEVKRSSLRSNQGWNLDKLTKAICSYCDISEIQLTNKARGNDLALAKALICYWGKDELGITLRELASHLQISQQAATKWRKQGFEICESGRLTLDSVGP